MMVFSARSSATMTMNLFIAIILSIGCHHFVESLASPSSSSCDTVAIAPSKSNRVFVAGISRTCTEQTIRSTFSHFGPVQEILLLGQDDKTKNRNRLPYCFVTFENVASAERAIAAPRPKPTTGNSDSDSDSDSVMYKEIQYERPKDQSTRRTRSNQSRMQEKERVTRIKEFGQKANLIVQVQSTHMDRMVEHLDLLGRRYKKNKKNGSIDSYSSCRVVGSTSANSKNVSLLFLSCGDPTSLARNICRNPLLARAVNKSYIVQSGLLEGNLATEEGCNTFSNIVFDKILTQAKDQDCNMILRMQVFPPKHQSRLLQSLDQVIYDDDSNKNASRQVTIDPTGFTHMLSVVEVYQYKGRGWESQRHDPNNRLYMFGVSPASLDLDVVDTNTIIAEDGSDDVNRAYYKLKEAIEMYKELHGELHHDLYQSIALDCGSAPGGWTKYLIEHFHCKTVFSIDPGVISPSVSKLKETCHMQMKIQDALPILLQEENEAAAAKGQIKIWVSDMCLHDMEEQATLLLLAKKKGLLAPNALFVLTLKCLFGHSKLAYDAQVRTVVDKFCGASTNLDSVEIFHLFSNRSGERTVIGYIN